MKFSIMLHFIWVTVCQSTCLVVSSIQRANGLNVLLKSQNQQSADIGAEENVCRLYSIGKLKAGDDQVIIIS